MLDDSLIALQHSALAAWAQQGIYPVIITFHAIGLAMLAGLLMLIDLRVLGFARAIPLPALRRLMTIVWFGFWMNAASGIILFSIDAKKDFHSGLFRTKMLAIAIGLTLGVLIKNRVLSVPYAFQDPSANTTPGAKVLATLSLVCWIGAIISGRLLAYLTFGDVGIDE